METRVVRQLFKDSASLKDYLSDRPPSVETMKRRMLLLERELNLKLPDHVYRNWRDGVLRPAQGVWPLLRGVLQLYMDRYIDFRGVQIHVQFDRFGEWQHELARLSLLPVIAYALFRRHGAPALSPAGNGLETYARQHLGRFEHTALLTPVCRVVEDLIERTGLYETHLHLNGSTEVDKIWQDALADVPGFGRKLAEGLPNPEPTSGSSHEIAAELYEQVELDLGPSQVTERLTVARRLRLAMARILLGRSGPPHSPGELLTAVTSLPFENGSDPRRHPIELHIGTGAVGSTLVQEILLLILVYDRLERAPDDGLACLLHAYLLILNATFVPLCVQQAEQYGFDQFQKFTANGVRWLSEGEYVARFHQLANGAPGDIAFLEGRFAPADRFDRLADTLRAIIGGYHRYLGDVNGTPPPPGPASLHADPPPPADHMRLRLIAHFIKQNELANPNRDGPCRFHGLRVNIVRQWHHLRRALAEFPMVRHYVTGVDAAANELHTPPEVFAPVFRAARRGGIKHVTYHVGEDFEHLLSGIRAVHEALVFLDLKDGNRIGHGTAVGIDPRLWLERVPERLRLRRGDRLDDLVFAYHQLLGCREATTVLGRLQEEIQRLSGVIYEQAVDAHTLWAAWQMRGLDALLLRPESLGEDRDEADERTLLQAARGGNRIAFDLFRRHHRAETVQRGREFETVDTALLDAPLLRHLQELTLMELKRRHVIIETLPTSNVRISFYQDFREHHVFRWLGIGEHGHKPMVSIGSDDPGIFACNLRGEIMHLYREILRQTGSEREAITHITHLNEISRIYRFE